MAKSFKCPRLTRRDFEELLVSHKALEAVIGALGRTNWAGAAGCQIGLMRTDRWVCDVYNRFERALATWNANHPDEPLYQEQLEQTAAPSGSDQATAIEVKEG